ncbi:hypothetical protein [Ruminococcus sp. 5_1_39BFAA]|uniref:hypothetical protein n=1 Tax=Ruminococcus sp. 5_1_39BFAA TaxID=457412 RepID=UPI003563AFED
MRYIISESYRKKLTDVCESSEKTMPTIKYMALGNGAVNEDGEIIELLGTETSLHNELLKKEIEVVDRDSDTRINYSYTVKIDELVDDQINEAALFDEDGDLVAMKVFETREKKPGMEMTFLIAVMN